MEKKNKGKTRNFTINMDGPTKNFFTIAGITKGVFVYNCSFCSFSKTDKLSKKKSICPICGARLTPTIQT